MVFNISILGSLQNSRNAISSLASNMFKKEKIYLNIVKLKNVMKISIATLTPLNSFSFLLKLEY